MDIDAPPAYTPHEAKVATFAEVATRVAGSVTGNPAEVKDALEAFRAFLANQENVTLSKNQLQVLKGQGVLVLEETANRLKSGGDASQILPEAANIFRSVSVKLESKTKWESVLQERDGPKQLETVINDAFNGLEALRELLKGTDSESTMNRNELLNARQEDQKELEELKAVIGETSQPAGNLATRALESMNHNLKIIGDTAVSQPHQDAKRALSIIAQLTGQSLPPSTILGKEFVTIGHQAIHQGSSYDIFLGEYFTGEKIAIKVLRHRVDEDTAKKTHEAFNWSALRHDAILPFYGVGVIPSPVAQGEFQLYLVSPYMQNQDAKRYLTKYNKTLPEARLQMSMDVARGLYYMHEAVDLPGHGIVHSALNISNVLIKDSGRAVISGFGHAKIIENFHEGFTGDNQEYRYMAPELMQDEPRITYGTDIYSWAMTTLEILTDVPPFGAKTKGPRIIQMVAMGQKPKRADHPSIEQYACKEELWALLEECWNDTPDARPSADAVTQRLKPMLRQLGKKTEGTEQRDPPPTGKGPVSSEYGKSDPLAVQGQAPPKQ
ncbi:hypothetical protein FS749_002415 [Ceratobasidium sp. UAMH 11750]|nr:hypothetical protein FS749_002415 [Ceratobasidium sp. UAMH 11750]